MTKPTSILGSFESKHIKLGAGRFFIGTPSATFAGTAKFDTNNPGPTWEDLGAIANDVSFNANADLLKYTNALPAVLKKSFVRGRDCTLQVNFDEFKSRLIQLAFGLTNPFNKVGADEFVVAASPAPTASAFTLDAVTNLAVGDEIVLSADTTGLLSSIESGIISDITGLVVTLRQPLRSGAPAAGWKVKERVATKLVFGGSGVKIYPLLYVVDFQLDNKQFVVFIPQASSQGSFSPNIGQGQDHAKVSITFDVYGVYDADIDDLSLASCYAFESEV